MRKSKVVLKGRGVLYERVELNSIIIRYLSFIGASVFKNYKTKK